jgi:hypothetical protein
MLGLSVLEGGDRRAMVAEGVHRRRPEQDFAATSPMGVRATRLVVCRHIGTAIDADVAGAFTDVLRALAEAARDRV